MEPEELLATSQGCGITSNNIKTSSRGICSIRAKVNSCSPPVFKFVYFLPNFALSKKYVKFGHYWNMSHIN